MNPSPDDLKSWLRDALSEAGAIASGFAVASTVDPDEADGFARWTEEGNNAGMEWLTRHADLRRDPRLLLDGARTVVSVAFPFRQQRLRDKSLPQISSYAYVKDYHDVIRKRLRPVCRRFTEMCGSATRICVDSAPVAERYWALRCGIGRRGDNGAVIIDGYGSFLFLAEILLSAELPPDAPSSAGCLHCGRCASACPGKAIMPGGKIRAQRCLSYLTIEHREPFPETGESAEALRSPAGCRTLYGCDICQDVCPFNAGAATTGPLPEFLPANPAMLTLDSAGAAAMGEEDWRRFTAGSAMRRANPAQLRRNALRLRRD